MCVCVCVCVCVRARALARVFSPFLLVFSTTSLSRGGVPSFISRKSQRKGVLSACVVLFMDWKYTVNHALITSREEGDRDRVGLLVVN